MAEDIGPKPQGETEEATQDEDEMEESDDSSGHGPSPLLRFLPISISLAALSLAHLCSGPVWSPDQC